MKKYLHSNLITHIFVICFNNFKIKMNNKIYLPHKFLPQETPQKTFLNSFRVC